MAAKKTSKADGQAAEDPDHGPVDRGIIPALLGAQIRRSQVKIYKHFEAWFAADDMTPLQFSTLNLIELNPGMSQKTMAASTRVERASFGESLARLEEKGLIERKPDAADRRVKVMNLTPEGRRVLQRTLAEIHEHERDCASNLSPAEQARLLDLLNKFNG